MTDDIPLHRNTPIPAVGVVCFNSAGEVLLIKRATPPRLGEWSIPGGRVEWGETTPAAALRELREETGVEAELVGLIDVIDGIFTGQTSEQVTRHYILVDYVARYISGAPKAGDDVSEARFVPLDTLPAYNLWAPTVRVIEAGRAKLTL
jgi:8-oxo-dGTP diphosphatase